jgi:two-component system phosphate regulon sensor histidine kinase PhoR
VAAGGTNPTRMRRLRHDLGLARPIVVLAVGVLVPVLLSSSVGIVALALWENPKDLVLGVLAVSFAAAAIGGGVIVVVLLGRRARLARMQSDLIGNVSHELKTPLAAIRMYAQTLQSGVVDDDPRAARTCADAIARETEWLGAMIERLLTWRAANRDRDNLDFVTAPLTSVATDAAARFERMLAPGEAQFSARVTTLLPVRHDPGAIMSVLMNLLTNAYKYTPAPRRIALDVEDLENRVVVRVTDNGLGIAPSDQKRIFEPFFRVDSSAGGRAGGAGLGLAIADVLARDHGGTLTVQSAEGQGSTFTVTLPGAAGAS